MLGHKSDNTRQRSRALVPAPQRMPVPASVRLRGVELDGGPMPPHRTPRRSWPRWVKIGGGTVAAFAIVLAAANAFAPSSWVEGRVAAWLKERTGRDLTVNGATRLSFLPTPHIEITDAALTEPSPGADAAELSIAKIEVDLGLFGFLGDGASISRLVLTRPELALHAGDKTDSKTDAGATADAAPPALPSVPKPKGAALADLTIDELVVDDGTIRVHGAGSSEPWRFGRINVAANLPSLSGPFAGRGRFTWRGKAVGFNFDLASPQALMEMSPAQLRLALETDTGETHFDGEVAAAPRISGQGTISAKTRSIQQLLAWLGGASAALPVRGEGEFKGAIAWTGDEVTLSEVHFAQANAQGEGHAKIALAGERPKVRGTFVVDDLNLSPALNIARRPHALSLLSVAATAPGLATHAYGQTDWFSAPAAPAAVIEQKLAPPPVAEIDPSKPHLLRPGPGVSQPSLTLSMPQDMIDRVLDRDVPEISAAVPFDADLNFSIRKARFGGLEVGSSAVSVKFNEGLMKATLWSMALYGGEGRGSLTVNVTDPLPGFSGDLSLHDIETGPLLKDVTGTGMLEGRGRLTLTLSGRGETASAMATTLKGSGAFALADGTIDGLDVAALVSGVESGTLDLRPNPAVKTVFDTLAGSVNINNGTIKTGNLRLRSASVNLDADGLVNLPRATLDILVTPDKVTTEQGGGVAAVADNLPPIRVEGPLAFPRVHAGDDQLVAEIGIPSAAPNFPGLVFRERNNGSRNRKLVDQARGATATAAGRSGQQVQPQALAPAFSIGPHDGDSAPPLRTESLR